jgi:hypothetical protein
MTNTIEGLDKHRDDFASLFQAKVDAAIALREYATPFARVALGDSFVDNPSGWQGWDVSPIYDPQVGLSGLNFTAIVYDDRGPDSRKTIQVTF